MLTYSDCLGLCDLTEEEIEAIAEHEHISKMIALELGHYLVHTPEGVPAICRMILDDIDCARKRGDWRHALTLRATLRHFIETHPEHRRETAGRVPCRRDAAKG